MKLTTKGRYAVTAMLDLALHDTKGPVSLADIAKRQEISLAYLEQLFAKLKKSELVGSARGPGGGYRLKRPAMAISVADVINAVDEPVDATRCGGQQNCQGDLRCLTHDLWADLNNQISTFLGSVTLGELMQRKNVKVVSARQDVDSSCTFKLMKRLDKHASVH